MKRDNAAQGRVAPSLGASGGGACVHGGGLSDKTCDIEGVSQDVAEIVGLGAVGKAEPGGTLESMPRLIGVAGLSITLAALTDVPGGGADLEIACEADVAVGKGEAGETLSESASTSWQA